MTKRKHGDGSVYKRKDGRWVAEIRLENGKKKSVYCQSEREANAALRKLLTDQEKGTLPTGPQITLKVYLEQWLEKVVKSSARSISTYNAYCIVVQKHVIPSLGYIRLQRLIPSQVQNLYAEKLGDGLSATRVKSIHLVLHRALENAVKWDLVARNVCDLVESPVPVRHEIQPLTHAQARKLIEAAQGHKLEALLIVALATGMRRGELLGLHWQDVDLKTGCIQVRQSVNRIGKHGVIVSEPKTKKSRRKILLPVFVSDTLVKHWGKQEEMKMRAGTQWQERGVVFPNRHGGYMETASLHRDFKKLLKRAGLPDIRFHDLRHSAATILLSIGVHPKVVQEVLGHSTISMTMDVYAHVLPSMQQDAVSKMDDFFKG